MSTNIKQTNTRRETRDPGRAPHQPSGDYEVGYCKPPKRTQFQKGCSGNRQPRRKRDSNITSLFKRVAAEQMTVSIGGEPIVVSKAAAALYAIYAKSVEGHSSAINGFLMLAEKAHQVPDAEKRGGFLIVSPTMTVEEWCTKYGTSMEVDT